MIDKDHTIHTLLFALMDELRRGLMSSLAEFGLGPPHGLVLKALDEPRSMKTVAAQLGLDPSYLTNLADSLEEQGFLERIAQPNDRRVKLLALTSLGRRTRTHVVTEVGLHAVGLQRLTTAEHEQLRKLLLKAYPDA
jgi:MarR family transcriptional regulator, organic hydroperoxide resistance regulator